MKIYYKGLYVSKFNDKDVAIAELNKKLHKLQLKDWWIEDTSVESNEQTTVAFHFGMTDDEFNKKFATNQTWEEKIKEDIKDVD